MFSNGMLSYILRFVNSVKISNVENIVIWSHIASQKFENLKRKKKCVKNGFLSVDDITNNLKNFLLLVGNEGSEDIKYNISKSKLNEAAKMFFSQNSCPSFFEKLYSKIIYGPDSRISILASNIVKKEKGYFKVKALKILEKIISVLGFQHISYHHGESKRNEKNKLVRNILDVKGKRPLVIVFSFKYTYFR